LHKEERGNGGGKKEDGEKVGKRKNDENRELMPVRNL
jgi:hypothetical protein